MAIQSSFYATDGTTRTFPTTKHIASSFHVSVWYLRVTDAAWVIAETEDWVLVNNSIVFNIAPAVSLYSQIEIRVADNSDELESSPSDISVVAANISEVGTVATNITKVTTVSSNIASIGNVSGSIANVNIVSPHIANVNITASNISNVNTVAADIDDINAIASTVVPNITEILLADNNATIATAKAEEASASAILAGGYAESIDPVTVVRKDSSTGAAYIPSGTTAQRPSTPTNGYMRFNTDLVTMELWNGTSWTGVGGGATGGGTDNVFIENEYTITASYTIPAGKSALSVGDGSGNITIQDGVTVTLADSTSRWIIL